jgi:hypothetical protein
VSLDPDAWTKIARLDGQLLTLARRDGADGTFVDGHEVRDRALAWAVEEGLGREVHMWGVAHYDEEVEDDVVVYFDTEAEAQEECADSEYLSPAETLVVVADGLLKDDMERAYGRSDFGFIGEAVNRWVAIHRPDSDGVWWADEYGPYSAPRGVILAHRLADWEIIRRTEI